MWPQKEFNVQNTHNRTLIAKYGPSVTKFQGQVAESKHAHFANPRESASENWLPAYQMIQLMNCK